MGPFDAWPTGGGGFEHFYGFIGAETNQWAPALYRDTVPVEPDRTADEGYHFTEDLTDRAIEWVGQQKALMPDKPFFVYFAPGATHAPHHVPPEWPDKYKGEFDDGWDAQRERTFARQKELGVIPADAELTARPAEIPAWDEMPDELKPVLARQMEVYAGFLEHVDHHLGRLVDALAELEILDDTLIYYVIGDNGASGEGTLNGTFNELLALNGAGALETTEFMASRIDKFGTPEAYNHYAVGWAHAMDTPYQWTKQVASHWGGTRNGTIVHWPARHPGQGRGPLPVPPRHRRRRDRPRRRRAAGADQRQRHPADAAARRQHGLLVRRRRPRPSATTTQYFEIFGNRGIYHEGWTAVTHHSTPWVTAERPAFDDDVWELYAPERLDPGPRPRRREPRQAARAPAPVPARSRQVQRVPARRPRLRALQRRHRRPAPAHPRQLAAAVRRHGPPDRELDPRPQEQVACRHRPDRRPRDRRERRDHRPRRLVRRLEPVRQERPADLLLQPARAAAVQDRRRPRDPAR